MTTNQKTTKRLFVGRIALALAGLVALGLLGQRTVTAIQALQNQRLFDQRAEDHATGQGRTFYVRPQGDDRNAGTSPASAWRTEANVNSTDFQSGDRILFEGGQTFAGGLRFDRDDAGTPARPITIGSFGSGVATIRAGSGDGLLASDTMGVHVQNLRIVGDGLASNTGSGITFRNDLVGDIKLKAVLVDHVDVSGFGQCGVLVEGTQGESGYQGVRITNVAAHDNAVAGVYVRGVFRPWATGYAHADVYIGHVTAYANLGLAGPNRSNTGSGIVLSDVDRGVIEQSVAHDNGRLCNSLQGGPVGIWAWDSNRITIQRNHSFQNRTGGLKDGGGFDLDGGTTRSVMQDNSSHDNDGAGYLLAQFSMARPFGQNVVRRNTSQNDGRKNGYGGIHVWKDSFEASALSDVEIADNSISMSPPASGTPAALKVVSPTAGLHFQHNLFRVTGGLPLLSVVSGQSNLRLENDHYQSSGSPLLLWEGRRFTSDAAWRAATGQEHVSLMPAGLTVGSGPQQRGP